MKKILLVGLFLSSAGAHSASFWTSDFTITNIYVSGGENLHYRIYGMSTMADCSSGTNWAYVNESDSGSKGKIAALLSTYAMQSKVRLYVTTANGFCRIDEIFLSP